MYMYLNVTTISMKSNLKIVYPLNDFRISISRSVLTRSLSKSGILELFKE